MKAPKPIVLCVDDEPALLAVLKEQLKRAFRGVCQIETAEDGEAALEIFEELRDEGHQVALIISDQLMPGMRGDELLTKLHAIDPEMVKIMLTGQAGTAAVGAAVNSGGLYRFITKPWDGDDLVLTVREALRRYDDGQTMREQYATLMEMNEAAIDLAGSLATTDRYDRLVQRVLRVLPADRAALLKFDADAVRLLSIAGEIELPPDVDLSTELAATLESPRVERRDSDPLWPGAGSALRVPLVVGDRVIGVLAAAAAPSEHFDDVSDARVDGFAALAAASMRSAELVDELEAALEHRRRVSDELLRQANDRVRGPLLGDSSGVRRLREQISALAARTDPVLIYGAPGAGSEAAARAIHAESARGGQPFLVVDCAMATALEDIFGNEGSAAPAALTDVGTLYLAGINRLPQKLQEALCARLDAGVDARIMAVIYESPSGQGPLAPLDEALHAKFFLRLRVPALRMRRQDLPVLADFFLRLHATRAGRVVEPLGHTALARLNAYDWPGNFPELSHVLQHALLASAGPTVEIAAAQLDAAPELGGYRLVELLGEGGMGEVWRGEHRHLARPAAIKLIRPQSTVNAAAAVVRFKREAAATARLCSPHTVELYDYGVNGEGSFFFVMELLRGLDLHRVVTQFGPLPPERVAYLLAQACRSLAEAHAMGLVHRDIKPANLMTCRLGLQFDFVKVLDFGMVTPPEGDTTELTSPGGITGTPGYFAPESIHSTTGIDGRADLYSLGCVAWFLLTGKMVFAETSVVAMAFAHLQRTPPDLRSMGIKIPGDLAILVGRCLAKAPEDRPASATELIRELQAIRFDTPWTEARAEAWWRDNEPELCEFDPVVPTLPPPEMAAPTPRFEP